MRQGAVHSPLAEGVGVAGGEVADGLLGNVLCPYSGVGKEEALVGGKAVGHVCPGLAGIFLCLLECCVSHLQATVVGQVLAEGEIAVGLKVGQHADVGEEIGHHLCASLKLVAVAFCPPVAEVAFLVKLAALVVESVSHLMTDDHADGAVVEGIVSLHVEEGVLQDAGGEAYLVGGGIVVGVDGLRVHIPLVAVNGLLVFFLHSLAVGPFAHILHRLVERLACIDVELGVVSPFVGVANLDIE